MLNIESGRDNKIVPDHLKPNENMEAEKFNLDHITHITHTH